jgi:hypothetical protein
MTNSQSISSSHALFTGSPDSALYLLERVHAFALQVPPARQGIDWIGGEAVLDLQTIPHHALEQFALRFRHAGNLASPATTHKAQANLTRRHVGRVVKAPAQKGR